MQHCCDCSFVVVTSIGINKALDVFHKSMLLLGGSDISRDYCDGLFIQVGAVFGGGKLSTFTDTPSTSDSITLYPAKGGFKKVTSVRKSIFEEAFSVLLFGQSSTEGTKTI